MKSSSYKSYNSLADTFYRSGDLAVRTYCCSNTTTHKRKQQAGFRETRIHTYNIYKDNNYFKFERYYIIMIVVVDVWA